MQNTIKKTIQKTLINFCIRNMVYNSSNFVSIKKCYKNGLYYKVFVQDMSILNKIDMIGLV